MAIINTNGNGIDTSDATALSSDIVKDKTAYVNGEKITGNINIGSNATIDYLIPKGLTLGTGDVIVSIGEAPQDTVYRKGDWITTGIPKSDFGNATASDVMFGKTFTSSAGIRVAGTSTGSKQLYLTGAQNFAFIYDRTLNPNIDQDAVRITLPITPSKILGFGLRYSHNSAGCYKMVCGFTDPARGYGISFEYLNGQISGSMNVGTKLIGNYFYVGSNKEFRGAAPGVALGPELIITYI